jgi:hypothetical protein
MVTAPRCCHVSVVCRVIDQVAWGLDANVDGAKPRIHFLKSFRRIGENLSKKS